MSLAEDIEIEPSGMYSKEDSFYWRTKDNRRIFIGDMTNSHILNTINKFGKDNVPKCMLFELLRRVLIHEK